MDIVMIGSGNTAAVLGRKLMKAGHVILQVMSRNASSASALAYEWDTESANYMSLINRDADVYIIAVNDSSIADVAAELRLPGKVVAHTAAAVDREILRDVSAHHGVLYPLQSLSSEKQTPPPIPLYYDGSDDKARRTLQTLAASVSEGTPIEAGDAARMRLHVAAVFVNNFTNHLYALAEAYCKKSGIDFRQLQPIIEETALRVRDHSPAGLQTGPAARHDDATIEKHLALLADFPRLAEIYKQMTASISAPLNS